LGGHAGTPAMTVGPLPSVARSEKELHVHAIADGGILEVIWSNRTSTTMYFTPSNFNASISCFGGGSAVEAVVDAWRLAGTGSSRARAATTAVEHGQDKHRMQRAGVTPKTL
jgi:hypothetical protein